MPELPEVEVTRRALLPLVRGRRIERIVHADPGRYRDTERAEGRRVLGIGRRGKFLLFELEGAWLLVVHLGMSGGFRLAKTPHTRVVFELEDRTLYFHDPRRFGRIWAIPEAERCRVPLLCRLGPEPWDPAFTPEYLWRRLKASRRPVKAILLDQTVVAGLGNIYADEALFRAGVRPTRRGHRIRRAEAERLHGAIPRVLEEAIQAGGSTLKDQSYRRPDDRIGYFQLKLSVYGREGEPCPVCGTPIRRTVIQGRSAYYCPRCQR